MNSNNGMILWVLGGAGVFLLYAAYKNQNPQALLESHITGTVVDKPISNYTAAQIPTVTDSTGKSYNTAPGDGGYITTDPPTPGAPFGSTPGTELQGYTTRKDISGTYNLISDTGQVLGVVPDLYQGTPELYIPVRA